MAEDNHNNDNDDQKRAERAHRPPTEQTGTNVGLLSPGTQTEYDPGFADDTRAGAAGAPPPPPNYPESLLGDPVLYEHGNEPVRISVFHGAQGKYGNQAVQRHISNLPVQRDNGSALPPVPNVTLTPPSILQPDNPAARYGLLDQYRFRIDPRTEAMMRQYVGLQFDTTLPTVQSAGASFQPSGGGQQPPPGGGTPPAGGTGGTGGSGGQGATPPAAPPPSAPSGSGSGTPNQPGAGPSTPQPASPGQIVSAALASEPFRGAWQNLQSRIASQAASDWRRLRLGEQIAVVSVMSSIAIGGLAGVVLTDDPSARQLLLSQLNGQTIPVPGAPWFRLEMNTSGEALMFGLHGDVGALLGPRFGFRPSSPSPIGGPPQPQSSYPPPPPVQRTIQLMGEQAWQGIATRGTRSVAVQRQHPTPPTQGQPSGQSDLTVLHSLWHPQVVAQLMIAKAMLELETPNIQAAYDLVVSTQSAIDALGLAAQGVDEVMMFEVQGMKTYVIVMIAELKPYLGKKEKMTVIMQDMQKTRSFAKQIGADIQSLRMASPLVMTGKLQNLRPAYNHLVASQTPLKQIGTDFSPGDAVFTAQIEDLIARVVVLIEELKPYLGMKEKWPVIMGDMDKTIGKALDIANMTPADPQQGGSTGGSAGDPSAGGQPGVQRSVQRTAGNIGLGTRDDSPAPKSTSAFVLPFVQRVAVPGQPALPVQRDDAPADAPAPPKVNQGKYVTTFKPVEDKWTVEAKTFREAVDEIMGRDEAGETSWNPVYNVNLDNNGKADGATVEVTVTVLMPEWAGAANLKGAEKKKWDDFMAALRKHEDGHVKLVKSKLDGIAKKMKGKTNEEAGEILTKAVDALKKASDEYDTKNDHGRKEGTTIEIEEEEKKEEESAPEAKSTNPLPPAVVQQMRVTVQRNGQSTYEQNQQLQERHKKAFEQAKAAEGKPALMIYLERLKMEARKAMTLSIERLVPRPSAYPNLMGFDAMGPAVAYATTVAGTGGAVVLEADKLFFVGALKAGEEPFDRDHAHYVTPQGKILAAVGVDGNAFPFNQELEPDPGRTKFQTNPSQAKPPSAEDMRKLAGVNPVGTRADQKPEHPNAADIPSGQEEAFILNYFRARGLEMLEGNELVARNLAETFKPTQEGDHQKEGKGVSKGAQNLIDSGRKLGQTYRKILDEEMKLALQIGELGRARSMSWAATEPHTIGGVTKQIREWVSETKEKQKDVEKRKNEMLSLSPMLAMMVESQAPPSEVAQLGEKAFDVVKWGSPLYWLYRGGKAIAGSKDEPTNPYDRSELAKEGSPEQDEKVRKEFMIKLDAVLEAIRETRSEVVAGDADLLFGMSGLRSMVQSDVSRIAKGRNAALAPVLERMLADHATKETWKTIGEVALQIGLLFVPGGQFLSAVFGFALAARDMTNHMQQFTASQATTDPSTALADQQAAQEALAMDTLNIVLAAVDVGTSTNEVLKAMEAGRTPKDPGKVKTSEAEEPRKKSPTDVTPPPGVAKPPAAQKPWDHKLLSDGFKAKLRGVGIDAEKRAISPPGVLSMSKNEWEEVKKFVFHSAENTQDNAAAEFFMAQMTAYRREVDDNILRSVISDINAEYGTKYTYEEIIEAVGSTNPTSDLDFTAKGSHAHEVVERFNTKFAQQFGGKEAGVVFDTNIYTTTAHIDVPVHTDPTNPAHTIPMKPGDAHTAATIGNGAKEWEKFVKDTLGKSKTAEEGEFMRAVIKEAEQKYPNDLRARLVHVHNFNQDVASQIGMCETLLGQGEAGAAKWQAHRKNILEKTPADKRDMMKRILDAAEHRTKVYQDEVIDRLRELTGKTYTPEEVAKMAHGTAEERNLYLRARNRLYEEHLQQLADLKKRYAEATTEAEKAALATQINAKQSESLYFASEAYQTGGSILSVVQNTQKAKGNVLDKAYATILSAESRQVFMEQYGKFMAYGPTLEHDAIFKASKYAERAFYGEMAHPLAAGTQPGILGQIKAFNGLKGKPVSELESWLKLNFPAATKEESLGMFFAAMEGELAGGAGRMAALTGKPVAEMELVWEQMAKAGGSKIYALLAMLSRARSESQ